jgi:hypothetical protein
MVVAWDTEKVVICAYTVQNMMVVAQMGSIRTTVFTSSTSVSVASRHLLGSAAGSSLIAAWSRNLQPQNARETKHTTVRFQIKGLYMQEESNSVLCKNSE